MKSLVEVGCFDLAFLIHIRLGLEPVIDLHVDVEQQQCWCEGPAEFPLHAMLELGLEAAKQGHEADQALRGWMLHA